METPTESLQRAVSVLLPAGIAVAVAPIDAQPRFRHGAEQGAVARAVLKRRRQFATGRRLAHALLDGLGAADGPLLPGVDRAPVWPTGFTGSISHTDEVCIVAVGAEPDVHALGIDVEPATPLEEPLWELILRPAERTWVDSHPEEARGLAAKRVFSAKECVYKSIARDVGTILEFEDVELAVRPDGAGFSGRVVRDELADRVEPVSGRWLVASELLVTAVARLR